MTIDYETNYYHDRKLQTMTMFTDPTTWLISYWLTCFVFDHTPVWVTVQVFHQSGAESYMANIVQ